MEKTSVQMEEDMIKELDAIATARGMNRSQVIRQANKEYIQACKDKGEIK